MLCGQPTFHALSLDGIADHARKNLAIDLGLHQVVLGSLSHRLQSHCVVIATCHDDDRQGRSLSVDASERGWSLTVGQEEVQENCVKMLNSNTTQCLVQGFAGLQINSSAGKRCKAFSHGTGELGIAFHQQRFERSRLESLRASSLRFSPTETLASPFVV